MAESRMIAGDAYVTKNGTYICPNEEVDIDSLTSFILDNEYRSTGYRKNYDMYTGLVCHDSQAELGKIAAFRQWILAKAAAEQEKFRFRYEQ